MHGRKITVLITQFDRTKVSYQFILNGKNLSIPAPTPIHNNKVLAFYSFWIFILTLITTQN